VKIVVACGWRDRQTPPLLEDLELVPPPKKLYFYTKCYCKSFQIHAPDEVTLQWGKGKLAAPAALGYQINGKCCNRFRLTTLLVKFWHFS